MKLPVIRHTATLLLCMAVTFLVYGAVYGHEFLVSWDDNIYVSANEAVRGFSFSHLKAAFTRFYVGNYAPLHIVSYMLDYTLWGMRPGGYLLANVFIHAVNGFLLYLLVLRLSGRFLPSIMAALLFLVHPAQVESVAWVSQRKSVLAMFFMLVSTLAYIAYRDRAERKHLFYLFSVASFTAALLTKSTAVILPCLLLLYDYCFESRTVRATLVDKIPFIAAATATAVLAIISQSPEAGAGGGRVPFHGGSPYATFLTMLPVLVHYLGIVLWPSGLSAAYAPAIKSSPDSEVCLAALLISLLVAGLCYLFRKERKLFFWGAIIPLGLLPVLQIVPLVTLINDRYLYFPMIGIAPFAVIGIAGILEKNRAATGKWVWTGVAILLLALAVAARQRVNVWHDSYSLWKDATAKVPESFMAWYNLGALFITKGQHVQARPILEKLQLMDPDNAKIHEMWGHYYYQTNDIMQAEIAYTKAIRKSPGRHKSLLYLGNIYLSQGRVEDALHNFHRAQEIHPGSPDIAYSIACAEALLHNVPAAINALDRAFKSGFQECEAIMINPELDLLRSNPEFRRLVTDYCMEKEK